MKFKIQCKNKEEEHTWWEDYDLDIKDARKWAEETIVRFNATLRPFEKPRELLDVEIIDKDDAKYHQWDKKITGMSVSFRGRITDLMFCKRCGITGKRFGLKKGIKIDSKYKGSAFRRCDTALKAMKELKNKGE